MTRTVTTPYDVAGDLRTPEEMAAYLEARLEEAGGDVDFIAKARDDITRAEALLVDRRSWRHRGSGR